MGAPAKDAPAAGGAPAREAGGRDRRGKTLRRFSCHDVLWATFEQMAKDLDLSVDQLINDAMHTYARASAREPTE